MKSIDSLLARMKAELDAGERGREQVRKGATKSVQERDQKIAQFTKACERLRDVWKPRLEALAAQFGEKVHVTPRVTPEQREAKLEFVTDLASVTLRLKASLAEEASNLVLDYELDIVPVLMDYERHARLEVPLGDAAREEAVAPWIDDRIIDFLRTYRSMFENEYYLGKTMVVDPVAGVRFPAHAAACSLERGGKTYHFISAETKAQFEKNAPAAPPAAAKPKPPSPEGAKPSVAAPKGGANPPAAPKAGAKPSGAASPPSPKSSDRPAPRADHRS